MKRTILFIIATLLSAQFVGAQTTPSPNFAKRYQDSIRNLPSNRYKDSLRQIDLKKNLLTNEEFFEKADLIAECKYLNVFEYYDAKGDYNPDDLYSIYEILVLKVFKGDTSLTGKTISFMKKGGVIYKPAMSEWEMPEEISSYSAPIGMDMGLRISDIYSSIQFLMKSDYPENPDKSKNYSHPKFKSVQNKERACIEFWGDGRIGGLNDLVFNNREELYKYMGQYKDIIIPQHIEPIRVPARRNDKPFVPTPPTDDLDSATRAILQMKLAPVEKKKPEKSESNNK